MPDFVGVWNTERFIDEGTPLEPLELEITSESPETLDGLIHTPGHDMTLHGSLLLGNRVWKGTYQVPGAQGEFVFILSGDGNAIAGGWTDGSMPPARAWLGVRR